MGKNQHTTKMAMRRMMRMKAAKAPMMRRKMRAMKVSIVGKKWQVFKGAKVKSRGGLKKSDLLKNKSGKVVSRKQHARGKQAYSKIKGWTVAVQKARKSLKISGFQAVGGKSAQGQALLRAARSFYKH